MTTVVLDASAVASWYIAGQATAGGDALLLEAPDLEFDTPHVFPTEVANLLLKAERRSRIPQAKAVEALEGLAGLRIRVHPAPDWAGMGSMLQLARAEGLSVYDALYLDLAIREGATVASRDAPLLEAAARRSLGVRDLRT